MLLSGNVEFTPKERDHLQKGEKRICQSRHLQMCREMMNLLKMLSNSLYSYIAGHSPLICYQSCSVCKRVTYHGDLTVLRVVLWPVGIYFHCRDEHLG